MSHFFFSHMKYVSLVAFLLIGASDVGSAQTPFSPEGFRDLSPARIQEIAGYLPDQPAGFGKPIDDRAFWTNPQLVSRINKSIPQAESLMNRDFPKFDDEAYLDYKKSGERVRGDKMEFERASWLQPLMFAECLEDRGRFIPALKKLLNIYTQDPTWTMPAHDPSLNSYHGTNYDVDLRAASFGLELAECLYLLGDKLDPAVRQNLETALRHRVFDPVEKSLRTGKGCFWLRGTNNWTAVCLAGSVGAALATLPDKMERAAFVAAGEHYSNGYVAGFGPDGYCEEGVGYYNYGFGDYIVLRQEMVNATAGKVDLFSNPRVAAMALFGIRIRIGQRTVPYFGDCQFGSTPSVASLSYCNEALGLGLALPSYAKVSGNSYYQVLITPAPVANRPSGSQALEDPLRSFFSKAGVLCCRPGPGSSCHLGIGMKAGGNGSHSHNDVGSYDISLDDEVPTGDPGGPKFYDATTFSPARYTHKLLNSFGHPVPVIAGQLQIDATKARPVVLSTSFSPDKDEFKIDFKSSYSVPELQSLTRTMDYTRTGDGEIVISDDVTLSSAQTFEDALETHGEWKQVDARTLMLTIGKASLLVTIETPDGFTVKPEQVQEMGVTFTRLGLALNKPISSGTVRMTFKPAP